MLNNSFYHQHSPFAITIYGFSLTWAYVSWNLPFYLTVYQFYLYFHIVLYK